jgi:hypothetical protein
MVICLVKYLKKKDKLEKIESKDNIKNKKNSRIKSEGFI